MSDTHAFLQTDKTKRSDGSLSLRRGFGRLFDLEILSLIWTFVQIRLLCISTSSIGGILLMLSAANVLLLICEPVLLSLLKFTPGKAIFGIRVSDNSGNKLTYPAAISRTWKMLLRGLGLRVFPFSILTLIICTVKKLKGKTLSWEENSSLRAKDNRQIRWFLYFILFLMMLAAQIWLGLQGPQLKGASDGSIRGFSDSYNRLLRYKNISDHHLDPDGEVIIDEDLSQYVNDSTAMHREFGYEIQNGKLNSVTGFYRPTQLAGIVPDLVDERMTLIKAMNAGLDGDARLNEIQLLSIQRALGSHPFASFTMKTDDLLIECEVMCYGYQSYDHYGEGTPINEIRRGDMLYPNEDTDSSFEMSFTVSLMYNTEN